MSRLQLSRRSLIRNGLTLAGGLAAGAFPSGCARAGVPNRKDAGNGLNVLWIGVDDLRCDLGCYGSSYIHSPNIDRLAAEGRTFQRAYVQQAVCAASRASFLTGCRPDTTTVDYPYNDYFTEEFIQTHPTLPTYYDQQGFHTRALGKIHHGSPYDLARLDEPFATAAQGDPWWQGYANPENRAQAEASRRDKALKAPAYEIGNCDDDGYKDGRLADEMVRTLEATARHADRQPFFHSIGFVRPHLPFTAPKKYWDLYQRDDLPETPVPSLPEGAPGYATATFEMPTYEGGYGKADNPVPEDLARTLRHGYFACISYIDAQVGKLLDALERTGLREKTVVMFWSDHGFHLGDQGMWGKHTNYEWSTRVPLIVSAPDLPQAGTSTNALVEYVDMFPTLCEMTGVPLPQYLEGTSMVPLLEDPARAWKTGAFSQYPRGELEGFSIRTEDHRYVQWRNSDRVVSEELYACDAHLSESVNLVQQERTLASELAQDLKDGWRAHLPPGLKTA